MITPLPNMDHDLGINNNYIDNLMSLSHVLFLKEEQRSTPLYTGFNTLHLDTTKHSAPITTKPEDDIITSVDESQNNILTNLSSNVKKITGP